MTGYVLVTLAVPFDPNSGEDHPAAWNWTTLTDCVQEVFVTDTRDVDPGERLGELQPNDNEEPSA